MSNIHQVSIFVKHNFLTKARLTASPKQAKIASNHCLWRGDILLMEYRTLGQTGVQGSCLCY